MKNVKFYVCESCGNVITALSDAEIICCGKKLSAGEVKIADDKVRIENVDDDYFITFNHEMTKENYISFAAYVLYDKLVLVKMYPEQNPEIRIPKLYNGVLYFYSTSLGLLKTAIR